MTPKDECGRTLRRMSQKDVYQQKGRVKVPLGPSRIHFQFVPQHRSSTTVVASERRLGNNDLLHIQRENWALCAELQRSSF